MIPVLENLGMVAIILQLFVLGFFMLLFGTTWDGKTKHPVRYFILTLTFFFAIIVLSVIGGAAAQKVWGW